MGLVAWIAFRKTPPIGGLCVGFFRVKKYLEESNPSEVEVFQKNVQTFVKEVLGDFKEYQMFCGEFRINFFHLMLSLMYAAAVTK